MATTTAPDLSRFDQPADVSDIDLAFGRIEALMPVCRDLPQEFREQWHWRTNIPCHTAETWFMSGLANKPPVREGIDEQKAWRHCGAIMRSWDPKHEHKIAGVGYLISRWFDLTDYTPVAAKEP